MRRVAVAIVLVTGLLAGVPGHVEAAPTIYHVDEFETSDPGAGFRGGYGALTSTSDGRWGRAARAVTSAGSNYAFSGHWYFADHGIKAPESLHWRYYVKFDASHTTRSTDIGKLPGPAGLYGGRCRGGTGSTASRPCWSARTLWDRDFFDPDAYSVGAPHTKVIGTYLYDDTTNGSGYGKSLLWNPKGVDRTTIDDGSWHCLEGHLTLNSPGRSNGTLTTKVDGEAADTFTGLRLRGDGEGHLDIEQFWFDVYYGGAASPATNGVNIDSLVLADSAIGCDYVDPASSETAKRDGSTASGSPAVPVGWVDRASTDGSKTTVAGWTFDPNMSSASIPIHVYVDGKFAGSGKADRPRADVNRAKGVTGNHGFDVTVGSSGREVCVYAINDGKLGSGSNPRLGCRSISGPVGVPSAPRANPVPNEAVAPVGSFERASSDGERATVVGWAYDQDTLPASIPVHVYVNGRFAGSGKADLARADVNRARGVDGSHGFKFEVRAGAGDSVCVYAINDGQLGSGPNPRLGCHVATGSPAGSESAGSVGSVPLTAFGEVGKVELTAKGVRIAGWAFDRHAKGAVDIRTVNSGQVLWAGRTNVDRADVSSRVGAEGVWGFDHTFGGAPVGNTCVEARNEGESGWSNLGCRSLANVVPVGKLDNAVVKPGGNIRATGWAFDSNTLPAPIRVQIRVNGQIVVEQVAEWERPDVNQAKGVDGDHGFNFLVPGNAGDNVCAYSIDGNASSVRVLLGCRTAG